MNEGLTLIDLRVGPEDALLLVNVIGLVNPRIDYDDDYD